MSLAAQVENGKLVTNTSSTRSTSSSGNGMDKEAFLQLLVAQMKYQDPLEPTSNTEYISQYAQFSQVEQMQNMSSSLELQRASSLVGQEVYMKVTTSTGETKLIQGKVDYVVYENGKAYLSIDESLYPLTDLDTVVDAKYLDAYYLATDFVTALNKLPSVKAIDLSNADAIDALEKTYNDMTDYQKTFIAKEKVDSLQSYIERLKEVRAAAEESGDSNDGDDNNVDETDGADAGAQEGTET